MNAAKTLIQKPLKGNTSASVLFGTEVISLSIYFVSMGLTYNTFFKKGLKEDKLIALIIA